MTYSRLDFHLHLVTLSPMATSKNRASGVAYNMDFAKKNLKNYNIRKDIQIFSFPARRIWAQNKK